MNIEHKVIIVGWFGQEGFLVGGIWSGGILVRRNFGEEGFWSGGFLVRRDF